LDHYPIGQGICPQGKSLKTLCPSESGSGIYVSRCAQLEQVISETFVGARSSRVAFPSYIGPHPKTSANKALEVNAAEREGYCMQVGERVRLLAKMGEDGSIWQFSAEKA
jgi:hypothetical protein